MYGKVLIRKTMKKPIHVLKHLPVIHLIKTILQKCCKAGGGESTLGCLDSVWMPQILWGEGLNQVGHCCHLYKVAPLLRRALKLSTILPFPSLLWKRRGSISFLSLYLSTPNCALFHYLSCLLVVPVTKEGQENLSSQKEARLTTDSSIASTTSFQLSWVRLSLQKERWHLWNILNVNGLGRGAMSMWKKRFTAIRRTGAGALIRAPDQRKWWVEKGCPASCACWLTSLACNHPATVCCDSLLIWEK